MNANLDQVVSTRFRTRRWLEERHALQRVLADCGVWRLRAEDKTLQRAGLQIQGMLRWL